jgi:hypothetical protein
LEIEKGKLTAHAGIASAEAWHGLVEHTGGVGGDVIVDELLVLVVGEIELLVVVEKIEMLLLDEVELEVLSGVALESPEEIDVFTVEVTVALTAVHGVVGLALAQAHREPAAPNTLPAEAPQALTTQFRAAD